MTFRVEKVRHLGRRVRNLEAAVAFSRDTLGLKDVARADFGARSRKGRPSLFR